MCVGACVRVCGHAVVRSLLNIGIYVCLNLYEIASVRLSVSVRVLVCYLNRIYCLVCFCYMRLLVFVCLCIIVICLCNICLYIRDAPMRIFIHGGISV